MPGKVGRRHGTWCCGNDLGWCSNVCASRVVGVIITSCCADASTSSSSSGGGGGDNAQRWGCFACCCCGIGGRRRAINNFGIHLRVVLRRRRAWEVVPQLPLVPPVRLARPEADCKGNRLVVMILHRRRGVGWVREWR